MTGTKPTYSKSRRFAEWLDSRFTIPGTEIKIGIDPILGLLTGFGDLAGASLSVYFMFYAAKLGGRPGVLIRMFVNILADLTIGAIPVLGDIFDIAWKANLRNARLLEELEANPAATESQSKVLMWGLFFILVAIIFGILILIGWLMSEIWQALF